MLNEGMSSTIRSIDDDRELLPPSKNPFERETALYEKNQEPGDIPALVAVPDFYHVGLPNIGHQIVEHQINEIRGFFAFRGYLDLSYNLLLEKPVPPEILFLSMSYEGSYIRSLRVLDKLGIPLQAKDRSVSDPLVVYGGRAVSMNPVPLFDTADIIGIGDSQNLVQSICSAYKEAGKSRRKMFDLLAGQKGVCIPSRYNVETKDGYLTRWEPIDAPADIYPNRANFFPHSWYLSSETDYNEVNYYRDQTVFAMEIVKACASKCLFCAEGFNNGERRFTGDVPDIVEKGRWSKENGAHLIKLFFPANATVEVTKSILQGLMAEGLKPRVGSAKAEYLDSEYIELVGKAGQEKIAFAPETGDEELRKLLGKPGMTNEILDNVITQSIRAGIPNIDLYFIMNLPGETMQSFPKTIELIGRFRDLCSQLGLDGRLRLSAPNFFPKAWTPFQYAASGEIPQYIEKIEAMKKHFGDKVHVSNMLGSVDLLSQNVMSRGGYEAGGLLRNVYQRLRNREDQTGTFTPDTIHDWEQAMHDESIDQRQYFSEKDTDKPLPWHHIKMHSNLSFLLKAWQVFGKRITSHLPIL